MTYRHDGHATREHTPGAPTPEAAVRVWCEERASVLRHEISALQLQLAARNAELAALNEKGGGR